MADEMEKALGKAMSEANRTFAKLGDIVEKSAKKGELQLDVAAVSRKAGIKIDAAVLDELKVDRIVYAHPWLHWCCWFPWRPLWCWWWHQRYPWYRCCPWWWHRCHWHPHFASN